ncbi:MAG: DUF1428 family protein [Limnobacter sp.]|nr:DUF1428 family protein [Limnobacter sp.]
MSYIDCFLAPVPRANKVAYEALAKLSETVVKEHGALSVMECWLDESGPDAQNYHGAETKQPQLEYAEDVSLQVASSQCSAPALGKRHAYTVSRDTGQGNRCNVRPIRRIESDGT